MSAMVENFENQKPLDWCRNIFSVRLFQLLLF